MRIVILFSFLCFFLLPLALDAGLGEIYRTGEIKLVPDPDFGPETSWDDLLYAGINGLAISRDGRIFVSAHKQHKVLIFSSEGKYLSSFGQRGQGPGDLYWPSTLSILDDKYLIVGEYPLNRRISVFDLNTSEFIKLVKPNYPIFGVVALKKNKIAILSQSSVDKNTLVSEINHKVYVKDINTGEEKKIVSVMDSTKDAQHGNVFFLLPCTVRELFVAGTPNGDLLVGDNYSSIIARYSYDGEKNGAIDLKLSPIKVTPRIVENHKINFIATTQSRGPLSVKYLRAIRAFNSYRRFFKEYLPYYSGLLVDDVGNILIFKYTGGIDTKVPGFRVYSPDGTYVCDSVLNLTGFGAPFIDKRFFNKIKITRNRFYGLFEVLGNEDEGYKKLVRVKI